MRLKTSLIALLLSIVLLGLAIHVRDGLYNPKALTLMTAAFAACGVAIHLRRIPDLALPPLSRRSQNIFLSLAIIVLAVFTVFATHTIRSSPRPFIDTFIQNRDSCDALLHGINPYTISFPDIYEGTSFTYPPGLVRDGRVMMGYPYVPLPLLLQLPSYAIFGDPRYAQMLALLLAGIFFIAMDLRLGTLAAILLLFTPRVFYVVDMSWVDSFMVMLLAATTWCALRKRRLLPIALGLFIASKQHVFLCLPLTFLLTGTWRNATMLNIKAVAVAALVSLPMAMWNFPAFFENTVMLQLRLPFRDDSLSYLAWIAQLGGPKLPSFIGFIALAVAMWFCLKRLRPSTSSYALAVAFSFFALFAFNKQAFCNYYFFVIGAMCCALASCTTPEEVAPTVSCILDTRRRTVAASSFLPAESAG